MKQEIQWLPGPDQTGEPSDLFIGPALVAVRVRRHRPDSETIEFWEFAVITINEDGLCVLDGDSWGWEWSDVHWYVPLKTFGDLPWFGCG